MMTAPLASVTSVEKIPDREWVPSDRRAENPEIWKEEDKFELDSWDTNKGNGMRRNIVLQFSASC